MSNSQYYEEEARKTAALVAERDRLKLEVSEAKARIKEGDRLFEEYADKAKDRADDAERRIDLFEKALVLETGRCDRLKLEVEGLRALAIHLQSELDTVRRERDDARAALGAAK